VGPDRARQERPEASLPVLHELSGSGRRSAWKWEGRSGHNGRDVWLLLSRSRSFLKPRDGSLRAAATAVPRNWSRLPASAVAVR
jgi:hypothetical protein